VAAESNNYLIVISDRVPLAWVLSEGRMAFSAERARSAGGLRPGDKAYLYTTRGCFHNPTADRGRVIAETAITSAVRPLDEPIEFGGRAFTVGCTLDIEALAPARTGVDLAEVVPSLHAFRVTTRWSVYLRRPLVPLDDHDAKLLSNRLKPLTTRPPEVLSEYQRLAALDPRARTA
jgi:hypothetical protein